MAEEKNILGLVIVVAGVGVGLFSGWQLVEGRQTDSWTEVQGTVISSNVDYNSGGSTNSEESWSPEVTFEYEVEGRKYTSSRVRIGGAQSRENFSPLGFVHCSRLTRVPVQLLPGAPGRVPMPLK